MSRFRVARRSLAFATCMSLGCTGAQPAPEANAAPAPAAATVAPVALPLSLATQLSLVTAGHDYFLVRDAQAIVDAGLPWREVLSRVTRGPSTPMTEQALPMFEALSKWGDGEAPPLRRAGIDPRGGLVVEGGPAGRLVFAATEPELAATLMSTLPMAESARIGCTGYPASPPLIACATAPLLSPPVPEGDGAARLQALERALPGIELAAMDVVFGAPKEGLDGAIRVTPGRIEVHFAGLSHPLIETVAPLVAAGPARLLRFVTPGASFAWARADVAQVQRVLPALLDRVDDFSALLKPWTGELLLSGSASPAGVQVRVGLADLTMTRVLLDELQRQGAEKRPFTMPELPGLTFTVDGPALAFGGEKATALRVRASGSPAHEAVAGALGVSLVASTFVAEDSLALFVGDDPAAVAAPTDVEPVLQALPPAAAADLRADATLLIVHLSLDALLSPAMSAAFDALVPLASAGSLADMRADIERQAGMSSLTFWVTRRDDRLVYHGVFEFIGHTADAEGLAALAALDAPAGAPAAFAALAASHPTSPRAASYRIRAGELGKGGLSSSLVASLIALGTLVADEDAGAEP